MIGAGTVSKRDAYRLGWSVFATSNHFTEFANMSLPQMLTVLAAAFALLISPAAAQEAAKDPARLAAAKELIEVTGAKKQIEMMLDMMKQGVGAGAREGGGEGAGAAAESEFAKFSAKFQGYRDQMIEEFAGLYAEQFTAAELKEVTQFYRSGAGAKFIAVMPELMQRGAAIGQKYGLMAVREIEAMKKNKP